MELQPAYILHTRPYRDTSMLIDFLTPDFGRVSAVARGVRAKKTTKRNLLNPFSSLLVSCQGKGSLKLLTHFEATGHYFDLKEKHLYAGFYINELLVRLLPELDAHEDIFTLYQDTLSRLSQRLGLEPVLRYFEFQLLASLGYGISFEYDANTGVPIAPDQSYVLNVQQGFCLVSNIDVHSQNLFGGHAIRAISEHNYEAEDVRMVAKHIARLLLKPLLGNKPLASRALFV